MPDSTLPPAILELVNSHFADADRAKAIELLQKNRARDSWLKCIEQVQRDMILAARGDLDELAKLSQMDYRDVIMRAEYMLRDGKIVRRDPPLE